MGLIHMNGRIFDPLIGRFMSADPFIQVPENLQSHNRFAYVMNNPLSYTDPSGYFSLKKLFRAVVAIAVGYFTGGLVSGLLQSGAGFSGSAFFSVATSSAAGAIAPGLTALGSAVASAAGGFAAGLVGSGGDLKAGLLGALSGGAFGFVGGTYAAGSVGNYVGHAVTGCVTSVAGGGKCGSGAASALFGKFATNHTQGIQNDLGRGIAAVVGSVIAGGKFENGAVTAAYGYLFNALLTGLKNGMTLRANYKDGHRKEHAVEGPGGSRGPNGESYGYHAHIHDAAGRDTGVRIHTHPDKFGQPLLSDDALRMTTDMKKMISDFNVAEQRTLYQMNRAAFHTGNVPGNLRTKLIHFRFPMAKSKE
jgi:hypothetical protein